MCTDNTEWVHVAAMAVHQIDRLTTKVEEC